MLFADSYLLTRSLPWHSTHLSPPSTAGEQSSSLFLLASNLLQPAHCLLLFYSYQHQHAPGCASQTLTFPLWCGSLWTNKISPQTVHIPRLFNSSRPSWSSFPPSCWLLYLDFYYAGSLPCLWDQTWGNEM